MFSYKIDALELLKSRGFNSYRIRKEKLFAEGTLQKFRTGQIVSITELDKLCQLCRVQPWDVVAFSFDNEEDDI